MPGEFWLAGGALTAAALEHDVVTIRGSAAARE
jgi:hypothetical protein